AGEASRGWPDGSRLPLGQARPRRVDSGEVLSRLNDKTRLASQQNLLEFGNALAGRGADLNTFIREVNPLLLNLPPLMRNLSNPQTRLVPFFRALARSASIVAPVAQTQADLFANLDTTFAALSDVRGDLQPSI